VASRGLTGRVWLAFQAQGGDCSGKGIEALEMGFRYRSPKVAANDIAGELVIVNTKNPHSALTEA
jgi:hypothetical protein